jgi:hypothetical protein
MQKKTFRKITLARETLRILDGAGLKEAAGGRTKTTCDGPTDFCTTSGGCPTATCNGGSACNCSG